MLIKIAVDNHESFLRNHITYNFNYPRISRSSIYTEIIQTPKRILFKLSRENPWRVNK